MILALAIVACLNYSLMFVEGGDWINCPDTGKSLLTDSCDQYDKNMGGNGNSSPYSCTPWNFRAYPDQNNGNCKNFNGYIVPGDGTNDVGVFASDNADNFFVFHSCDGAGGMTDCKGNRWFVEQYGPWCGANGDNGNDCSIQCDLYAPGGDNNPSGQHQQCNKYHDGTGKHYEWYKCGNWSAKDQFPFMGGFSGGFAEYKNWFRTLFPDSNYINTYEPDGTVVLYDWVCHQNKWTKKNLQAFTGDSIVNCYCDNEPYMSSGGVPPGAAVYSFWVKWDANRNGGNGEWYLEMHDITTGWEVGDIFNIYPFNAW